MSVRRATVHQPKVDLPSTTSDRDSFALISLLRAVAAAWVLVAHCMIWGGWQGFYGVPIPNPKVAVDLFMLISGFLMVVHAKSRSGTEPLDTISGAQRFWLRRWFRVAPSYFLSLLMVCVVSTPFLSGYSHLQSLNPSWWPSGGTYDPSRIEYTVVNILLHVSFIFGLLPKASFSTFLPDWSLSLEMQFYAIFPLLYVGLRMTKNYFLVALLGTASYAFGLFLFNEMKFAEPSLLPMKLNFFLGGMLTAWALLRRRESLGWRGPAVCALALASLGAHYSMLSVVLPLSVVALLLYDVPWSRWQKERRFLDRLLCSKVVTVGSDLSYGAYLFHGLFIAMFGVLCRDLPLVGGLLPTHRVALMICFVVVLTYSFAFAVHRLVELPSIRAGSNIIRKIGP